MLVRTLVARQVQVPAAELDAYEWSGRTVEYHRAQIRGHLGFRECSVVDADKLTGWLAEHVACKERRPEQVRVELLARCIDRRRRGGATGSWLLRCGWPRRG